MLRRCITIESEYRVAHNIALQQASLLLAAETGFSIFGTEQNSLFAVGQFHGVHNMVLELDKSLRVERFAAKLVKFEKRL